MFKIEPKPEGLFDSAMSLDNEAGEQEDKEARKLEARKQLPGLRAVTRPRIIEHTGVYGILVRWEQR